jgi:hypothetical protein
MYTLGGLSVTVFFHKTVQKILFSAYNMNVFHGTFVSDKNFYFETDIFSLENRNSTTPLLSYALEMNPHESTEYK